MCRRRKQRNCKTNPISRKPLSHMANLPHSPIPARSLVSCSLPPSWPDPFRPSTDCLCSRDKDRGWPGQARPWRDGDAVYRRWTAGNGTPGIAPTPTVKNYKTNPISRNTLSRLDNLPYSLTLGRVLSCPVSSRRHARTCSGHPRSLSLQLKQLVDGRDKPGHDVKGETVRTRENAAIGALGVAPKPKTNRLQDEPNFV